MKRIIAWALVLILCLGMFAGCKKGDADSTDGAVVVDTAALEAALEYVKTVYRKTSETTPKDFQRIAVVPVNGVEYEVVWTVNVAEDLVKVLEPENGMVTIDVNEQSSEEVPYELTATISDSYGNSVSHTWKHILPAAISLEDMLEIVKAAYALPSGESMGYDVTLVGKITMINTPWSDDYQNITVTIVIEGAEDMPIQCYRLKGEGAKDLKIGDTITVTGMLKNYNGTIEFDAGCTLDAVVPGEEVKAPEDPKQIVDEAYALGANQSLPYEATLTGVITEVGTPYNAQYGNVTVTMVVEGRESKPIVCYRLKGDGVDKIGVNDLITVKGYITNYVGSKGKSTIEFTAGCQLIKWEDRLSPTQPSDPKVVVDQAYALGANETLKYEATLTGKITKVNTAYDPNYGNVSVTMVIEGRESKPILCYRMKGTGVDKISIGDTITVKGYITNYVGDKGYSTIEYNYPTLISYEKNTAVAPTDSLTIVKEAYQLAAGEQLPYEATVTGKIISVDTPYDIGYKNVTVTIVVEGAEDMPIKCYRLKGDGADKIGVDDIITVKGFIENFVHSSGDSEIEFTAGCQIVSWENTGADAPVVAATPISIADAVAKGSAMEHNKYTTEKYSVTGVISEVYSTTYGNMYLTDGNGNTLTIYGTYDSNGNRYDAMTTKPVAGDTVTIEGPIGQYNGVAQIKNGVIVSHTPGSGTTPNPDPTPDPDPEPEPTPEVPEIVTAPVAGTAYKLFMNKTADNKVLFFNGQTESASVNFRLASTEAAAEAVDVYLEAVDGVTGGFRLYFMNGAQKTYIRVYERNDGEAGKGKGSLEFVTEVPAEYFTYDSTVNTLIYTADADNAYYMGTYSTYTTFSVSNTFYITGENASAVDDTQFPARFAVVETEDPDPTPDPDPEEPTVPELVTAPEAGTVYKLGMIHEGVSATDIYFINGQMKNTYYFDTTTDTAAALDVVLEETTGGYYLSTTIDGAKKYINFVVSGTHVNSVYEDAAATVFTYDATLQTVVAVVNETTYCLGTSASKTFTTVGPVKTTDVYYMKLYTVSESTEPEQPEEPTAPELVTAPEAGTAYKLGMIHEGVSATDIYFIDGQMKNTYYFGTTTDTAAALDVVLEETTGGYYLSTTIDGAKKYINFVVSGTHVNSVYEDAAATVFTYDATLQTVVAVVNETTYCLGTSASKTFTTVGPVKTTDVYYAKLYIVSENTEPEQPEEPTLTTPEQIVNAAYALEENTALTGTYTLSGVITSVDIPYDSGYQNVTVTIVVEGMTDKPIQCFRMKGTGADVIAVGDNITVTGTLKNYYGKVEFDANCTLDSYKTPAQVLEEAYALAAGASLPNKYTLTGVITSVDTPYDSGYQNVTVTIVVGGLTEQPIKCFRLAGEGADTIEANDTITVTGILTNYSGTIEFAQGCTLDAVTKAASGGGNEEPTPPATTSGYTKVGKAADLTAGTYQIAVYSTAAGEVDFSANPYHFWDGTITTSGSYDLVTNTYAYAEAEGTLTKYEDSSVNASKNGDAVTIELIAVEGEANTYYIKFGDKYLSSSYDKRKLALSDTPAAWVAEDHANGGIVLHHYVGTGYVTMGYGNAEYNMIRSYKDTNGAMNTGVKSGLYFFKEATGE